VSAPNIASEQGSQRRLSVWAAGGPDDRGRRLNQRDRNRSNKFQVRGHKRDPPSYSTFAGSPFAASPGILNATAPDTAISPGVSSMRPSASASENGTTREVQ
jgi:hypothetical protein